MIFLVDLMLIQHADSGVHKPQLCHGEQVQAMVKALVLFSLTMQIVIFLQCYNHCSTVVSHTTTAIIVKMLESTAQLFVSSVSYGCVVI